MNKMDGKSMDLTAENIAQLKKLFPEAVTEGKVDFEVLKELLGGEIETRKEYYKFTWNGKEAARAYALTPSKGTLRPCVEESSGKDGTPGKFDSENLYIEGDNLEVLKLLQGSYHKKIKMIYIDPPYNTGKDFVYPDNYRNPLGEYKALTGQTDAEGKSTRANPETSGRYHTDWLNMMYPRLILARNLLTDDGAIFISIDDTEFSNLRKLCDNVFGEENFIGMISLLSNPRGSQNSAHLSYVHEYVLVYSKNEDLLQLKGIGKSEKSLSEFCEIDGLGRRYRLLGLRKRGGAWRKEDRPNMFYPIYVNPQTGSVSRTRSSEYSIEVIPQRPSGELGRWCWGPDKFDIEKDLLVGRKINRSGDLNAYDIFKKDYMEDADGEVKTTKLKTMLIEKEINYQNAKNEIKSLFGDSEIFDFPKPTYLIKLFMKITCIDNDFVLDFFSGSGTTAHAEFLQNLEDNMNLRFILVQLPEHCHADSRAAIGGYKTISKLAMERIRRAAKEIREEKPLDCLGKDMGFKVFKLDTSNLREWNPNSDTLAQDLLDAVNNILAGRTTEDLLYEVLLKCNLPLTLPIEERKVECVIANGKTQTNTIYVVGMGALAICLDENIPQTIAEEIVKLRNEYAPVVPMQVVFRDNGFDDVSKTNALQILKQAGFEEKSIQTI